MFDDTRGTSEICRNEMLDWNGRAIPAARSKGGVKAVSHPYDNLIRTGFTAWPPPKPKGVYFRTTLWRDICLLDTQPLSFEQNQYYLWKINGGGI